MHLAHLRRLGARIEPLPPPDLQRQNGVARKPFDQSNLARDEIVRTRPVAGAGRRSYTSRMNFVHAGATMRPPPALFMMRF